MKTFESKSGMHPNLKSERKLDPKILADLKPEVKWSRKSCGRQPCKGKYS